MRPRLPVLYRRVLCQTTSLGFAGILFTPISQSGHISWNVAMRQQLDIYASVVLCKSLPGFPTRHENVDFAIIRENTEGEYSSIGGRIFEGTERETVIQNTVFTRVGTDRIIRYAFELARSRPAKKLTSATKSNGIS